MSETLTLIWNGMVIFDESSLFLSLSLSLNFVLGKFL